MNLHESIVDMNPHQGWGGLLRWRPMVGRLWLGPMLQRGLVHHNWWVKLKACLVDVKRHPVEHIGLWRVSQASSLLPW